MRIHTNECVSCGMPCLYESCRNYNVERFLCDKCKEETTLYEYDTLELCANCLLEQFQIVEGSEW